jgi:hypothetical protein
VRTIGSNARRAKLQVTIAITNVCSAKARAGSLLAVASNKAKKRLLLDLLPDECGQNPG